MITAPAFWWQPPGKLSRMLAPLGSLYRYASDMRTRRADVESFRVPIICVGNVTLGGAGKTPFTIALAEEIRHVGKDAHVVSRGYGGSLDGPVRVDISQHRYLDVGDEPLLIARSVPCWVAKDRKEGVRAAIAQGAEVVILDDGLQHPFVRKDVSFLVIDGGSGIGNGMIFPAGPLRESLNAGLAKSAAVILIGDDATGIAAQINQPIFHAGMELDAEVVKELLGAPVFAFAGIGRPEKFFASLRQAGINVSATRSFPDHHPYCLREIQQLREEAEQQGQRLVTTEKDHFRIPPVVQPHILPVPARLHLDNWPGIHTYSGMIHQRESDL